MFMAPAEIFQTEFYLPAVKTDLYPTLQSPGPTGLHFFIISDFVLILLAHHTQKNMNTRIKMCIYFRSLICK